MVGAVGCKRSRWTFDSFKKRFIRAATAPGIDTAALSLPRRNGKSWLAGYLLTRILDPGDKLFRPGTESILCAASIEQACIDHIGGGFDRITRDDGSLQRPDTVTETISTDSACLPDAIFSPRVADTVLTRH